MQPRVETDAHEIGPIETRNEAQSEQLRAARMARHLHPHLVGGQQPLRGQQPVDLHPGEERITETLTHRRRLDLLQPVGEQEVAF